MKCPKCGSESLEPVLRENDIVPALGDGFFLLAAKDGAFLDRCLSYGCEFTEDWFDAQHNDELH